MNGMTRMSWDLAKCLDFTTRGEELSSISTKGKKGRKEGRKEGKKNKDT